MMTIQITKEEVINFVVAVMVAKMALKIFYLAVDYFWEKDVEILLGKLRNSRKKND